MDVDAQVVLSHLSNEIARLNLELAIVKAQRDAERESRERLTQQMRDHDGGS